MKIILTLIIVLFSGGCLSKSIENKVYVTDYGVIGNGVADDTIALQEALKNCSIGQIACVIPKNKKVRITGPIYIWNKTSLIGEHRAEIQVDFIDLTERFVLNLGIAGKQLKRPPFQGKIKGIIFRALSGPTDKWLNGDRSIPIAARFIQCFRCKHTTIKGNKFEAGPYFYGATASQNNANYMRGSEVHHNITIKNNVIHQDATSHGQECIGIGPAQDVLIKGNKCVGSGDDLIGAHFVDGLVIKENSLFGVDGRIYVSNGKDVIIKGNHIERMASTLDGQWYKGNTLIYLGYETPARVHPRPERAVIKGNVLVYPEMAIDGGAAISIQGASDVLVKGNIIRNESQLVTSKGIWVAPWRDSQTPELEYEKYYIENVSIRNNKMTGDYPLQIFQTDSCVGYKGFLDIINNESLVNLSCPQVVNANN